MDIGLSTVLTDQMAALKRAQAYRMPASGISSNIAANIDTLPATIAPVTSQQQTSGTKLLSETRQDVENGYRVTKTYERDDDRQFTRVEDFAFTERGSRRTVTQQNPSGSITQYEEVLDREDSGNFRRTQRFRDETGETATQITSGYKVTDPFILSGGYVPAGPLSGTAFATARGTQLDLSA